MAVGVSGLGSRRSARAMRLKTVLRDVVDWLLPDQHHQRQFPSTRSIAAMTAGSSGSSPSARNAWRSSSSTPFGDADLFAPGADKSYAPVDLDSVLDS
jgi:hypothetical protein